MLLLTLKAGTNRYAINVARVIELVPKVELTLIPHAPQFVAGLLAYRGKFIPVIDLGLLFNNVPCRDCLSTRIILVNEAQNEHNPETAISVGSSDSLSRSPADLPRDVRLLGLIGEQVSDLTDVPPEQIARSPVQLSQVPFFDGIVQTEDGIMQLLAVERIRDKAIGSHILDSGAVGDPLASNPAPQMLPRENAKTSL
jgi:chemotaxis-related protein WspB